MDEIDRKILQLLKENARMSYVEIGRTLGISEGAVRNRVQALIDSEVIRKFTVELAPTLGVRALILISVSPSVPTVNVSRAVQQLSDLEKIYEITGEYDIVAVVASESIESVNHIVEQVRMIQGVASTNTMIVLRTL